MRLRPAFLAVGSTFVALGIAGPPLEPLRTGVLLVVLAAIFMFAERCAWQPLPAVLALIAALVGAYLVHASGYPFWKASIAVLFAATATSKNRLSASGDLPLASGAVLGTLLFFFG